MNTKRLLTVALLVALAAAAYPALAGAQDAPEPAFAYIKGGNLWLRYDDGADVALTDDAVPVASNAAYPPHYEIGYEMPRWSPNGKWLAFVRYTTRDNGGRTLYVADVTQPAIRLEPLAAGLGFLPPSWQVDNVNPIIAYATHSGQYDESGLTEVYNAFAISPEDPAREALMLGSFGVDVGCGGGTADPAAALYWRETTSLGGYGLTFAWAGARIVHSTDCGGSAVALLDLNARTDTPFAELSRVAVSPDGGFIAGVAPTGADGSSSIHVYSLDRLDAPHRTFIVSTDPRITPAQLAWNASTTGVFYSLQQLQEERTPPDSMQQRGLSVFGSWPVSIRVYFSGLHFYNLVNNADSRLYTAPAHVLAGIAVMDGNHVAFTQIDNADMWLDVFQRGGGAADLSYNLPGMYLVQVRLSPPDSAILIEGAGQVAVRPAGD